MLAQPSQVRPMVWPVIRRVAGDLRIHGDLTQMQIEVSGNLTVDGIIQGCNLKVGGHLKAQGLLDSQLQVEGQLEAHYLRKCHFLVGGDLCVSAETSFCEGEVRGLALPGWVVESRLMCEGHLLAKGVITNRQGGSLLWAGYGQLVNESLPTMLVVLERLDAGTRLQVNREGTTLRRPHPQSAFCLIQGLLVRLPLPAAAETTATPEPATPAR